VSALGVAQEDGALGDPVRVMNAASRRHLQGIVSGPDEVALGTAAAARAR
jgi:flagella basal body P-ring formation protein FlgA